MNVVILAMLPIMHRGHLISLLSNVARSEFFYNQYDDRTAQLIDQLITEAGCSFGPFDTFAHGPLLGQLINSVPTKIQALNLAPRLVISDPDGKVFFEDSTHVFVERVFTAFILNSETRHEIVDVMELAGGNPITAQTFIDLYYGLPAVALID